MEKINMIKKKPVVIIALLMVLVLSLCACEPDFVGNKYKTKNKYVLSFSVLNKTEKEELYLEKGDGLEVSIELTEGEVSLLISSPEGEEYYKGNGLSNGKFTVTVERDGRCRIWVTGDDAKGSLSFKRIKAE